MRIRIAHAVTLVGLALAAAQTISACSSDSKGSSGGAGDLASACKAYCNKADALNCSVKSTSCVSDCESMQGIPQSCLSVYTAYGQCIAGQNLTCSSSGTASVPLGSCSAEMKAMSDCITGGCGTMTPGGCPSGYTSAWACPAGKTPNYASCIAQNPIASGDMLYCCKPDGAGGAGGGGTGGYAGSGTGGYAGSGAGGAGGSSSCPVTVGDATCDACAGPACCTELQNCTTGTACDSLVTCIANNCSGQTGSALQTCVQTNCPTELQNGVDAYNALSTCLCQGACTSSCSAICG